MSTAFFRINHITLAVSNIDVSFAFYTNVLGFKPLCQWNNGAYLLCGNDWFCLNVVNHHILQDNTNATHYAFSVSQENFSKMSEKIINSGIKIYKENLSEGDSVYFVDPDGHKLELHVGNWQSRINAKKLNQGSWQNIIWYI